MEVPPRFELGNRGFAVCNTCYISTVSGKIVEFVLNFDIKSKKPGQAEFPLNRS